MHESHALFYIGPLGGTGEITTMWVIMALLVVFSFIATRNLKERPGKLQNVAETIVEKLVTTTPLYWAESMRCAISRCWARCLSLLLYATFPACSPAPGVCGALCRPRPPCR